MRACPSTACVGPLRTNARKDVDQRGGPHVDFRCHTRVGDGRKRGLIAVLAILGRETFNDGLAEGPGTNRLFRFAHLDGCAINEPGVMYEMAHAFSLDCTPDGT